MAWEISPMCDFIFGSIRTSLLTDKVDVGLTIQVVKGIYKYRKDHTAVSTIFTWWSKKVIPFPSLRCKIQAFWDDKRQEMALPWNDSSAFQLSAPPKMPRNPWKRTTGKIRTRWLGKNRFNPIKARRSYTQETKVTDLDRTNTDIKASIPIKAHDRFRLSCSYCKQGALHPPPQDSRLVQQRLEWD